MKVLLMLILCFSFLSCSKERNNSISLFESDPGSNTPTDLKLEKIDPVHIFLEWQDNSEIEDGFIIDRKKYELEDWTLNYAVLSENCESFVDSIEDPNAKYYYRLCAFKEEDVSFYSIASIDICFQPPNGLQVEMIGSTEAALSWNDNSEEETGYRIDRIINNNTIQESYKLLSSNTNSFSDEDVSMYNEYEYHVYAMFGDVLSDSTSAQISVSPYLLNIFQVYRPQAIHINGDYAYCESFGAEIVIANISDPLHPYPVSICDIGPAHDIIVENDYMYVASDFYGFFVADISDPFSPEIISNSNTTRARNVYLIDNLAYVADLEDGLLIFDISNPHSPYQVGIFNYTGVLDVFVQDDLAYIMEYDSGMRILDISTPQSPISIGRYVVGNSWDLIIENDTAFFISDYDLTILDVSNPADIELITVFEVNSYGNKIFLDDDYLFIQNNTGFEIVDISDSQNPSQVGSYDFGNSDDIFIKDKLAYLTVWSDGLKIIQIAD